jgi:hypothetical protein
MADTGAQLQLKLSDGSMVQLQCSIDLTEAMSCIEAAVALQHQEHRVLCLDSSSSSSRDRVFDASAHVSIPGTLHHVTAMRELDGHVYGITYHIGRHVPDAARMLADVLSSMKASLKQPSNFGSSSSSSKLPRSLLLLGRQGCGKRTLLRDIARLMSLPASDGGLGLSVVLIDTDGQLTGPCRELHLADCIHVHSC